MKKILYILGMVLLSGLLVIGFYAVGTVLKVKGFNGTPLFYAFLLLALALYVLPIILFKIVKKNIRISSKGLRRWMQASLFYEIAIFSLLIAIACFAGASPNTYTGVPLLFVGYGIYCFLSAAFMNFDAITEGEEVEEENYPVLFRIARHALDSVGFVDDRDIRIYFRINFAVSCVIMDSEVRILLGTHLPAILNEYELEAIITAELGLTKTNSPTVDVKIRQQLAHWQIAFQNDITLSPNFFLLLPVKIISAKAESFLLSLTKEDETIRCRTIGQYGIPDDYIGAYAKMLAYDLFLYSPGHRNPYAGEQPPRDFQECLVNEFRAFLSVPMPLFRNAILHHRPFEDALSLEERMEILSVTTFSIAHENLTATYTEESDRILKIGNEQFADDFSDHYEKLHREHYLIPQECIEHYHTLKSQGETVSEAELLEVVSALRCIGAHESAEAILDSLLKEKPQHALAAEGKGQFLLERYDPAGIEYLSLAMEENYFSAERNMRSIVNFYRRVGDIDKECEALRRLEEIIGGETTRQKIFHDLNRPNDFTAPPLSSQILNLVTEEIQKQMKNLFEYAYILGINEPSLKDITYVIIKVKAEASPTEIAYAMKRLFLFFDNRNEWFYLLPLEEKPIVDTLAGEIEGIHIIRAP